MDIERTFTCAVAQFLREEATVVWACTCRTTHGILWPVVEVAVAHGLQRALDRLAEHTSARSLEDERANRANEDYEYFFRHVAEDWDFSP